MAKYRTLLAINFALLISSNQATPQTTENETISVEELWAQMEETGRDKTSNYYCINITTTMDDATDNLDQNSNRSSTVVLRKMANSMFRNGQVLSVSPNGNVYFNYQSFVPEIVSVEGEQVSVNFLYKEIDASLSVGYTGILPEIRQGEAYFSEFKLFSSGCDMLSQSCDPTIETYVCQFIGWE